MNNLKDLKKIELKQITNKQGKPIKNPDTYKSLNELILALQYTHTHTELYILRNDSTNLPLCQIALKPINGQRQE